MHRLDKTNKTSPPSSPKRDTAPLAENPLRHAEQHAEVRVWALAKILYLADGQCRPCLYKEIVRKWPDLKFREYVTAYAMAKQLAGQPQHPEGHA
jgi:hypothetical protein